MRDRSGVGHARRCLGDGSGGDHPAEDSDKREVAELGTRLRRDLGQTPATRIEAVSVGSAPSGSKGLEVLALGHFVVEISRSFPALRKVVAVLRDYVIRQPVRSVKISLDGDVLEVTAASSEDQRRLDRATRATR